MQATSVSCKPGRSEGVQCVCSATECLCVDFKCILKVFMIKTPLRCRCLKKVFVFQNINQCLCTDSRCGFPSSDEVPLIINLFFITVSYTIFTFLRRVVHIPLIAVEVVLQGSLHARGHEEIFGAKPLKTPLHKDKETIVSVSLNSFIYVEFTLKFK